MTRKYLLEMSVETVDRAAAAERGGADRIELCAELTVGGLTPSRELQRSVRENARIPIFSMIRPRAGDFVYSAEEFGEMKRAIASAQEAGMNGVVLGILHTNRNVDVERTRELVALARPLPVTFHRAFDECADLPEALEAVIQTGAARILTSGGAASAWEGAETLAKLIAAAGNRMVIVPGAGIHAGNIPEVARRTGAREFHSGLSTELRYTSRDVARFEACVRNLGAQLGEPG